MNHPRLSLCIPTFNRAQVLSVCLQSLIAQCQKRPLGEIEICVSDNASPDETQNILKTAQAQFPLLRFSRHDVNKKIDRNIVSAAKLARADWIWFLSDDDVLEDGALESVLNLIRDHSDKPAILVNRIEYDAKLERPVGEVKPLTQMGSGAMGLEIMDAELALTNLLEYLGYLPAWIVQRSAWNQVDPTPFLDTDFVHVGVGLLGAKRWAKEHGRDASVLVCNQPIVRCRLARASWRNRHYEVWIRNWQTMTGALEPEFSHRTVMEANAAVTQNNLISLVSGRGLGPYSFHDFKARIWPYVRSPIWLLVAGLVSLTPRGLARAITALQRQIRNQA